MPVRDFHFISNLTKCFSMWFSFFAETLRCAFIWLLWKGRNNRVENVLFHWTVVKCEAKKGTKMFNILIPKWSRKITTEWNEKKSDIYCWWFGIVSRLLISLIIVGWGKERKKILRQNCQHLVTRRLRFFISFLRLMSYIIVIYDTFPPRQDS